MTPVEQAVVATLAYFDVFSVPLTSFEVWRYLFWPSPEAPPDLFSVTDAAQSLADRQVIARAGPGFWSLRGGTQARERLAREADAVFKWRRLAFGVRLLSQVPFLSGVAAVNTLPIGAARTTSDIDLLVIARPGRLFLVRLLAVCVTSVFGIRRHGALVENRLCLSFFLSEQALDLRAVAKQPEDPHLRAWTMTALPLFERDAVFGRMWAQNAAWLSAHPNASPRRSALGGARSFRASLVQRGLEWACAGLIGDGLEWCAKRLQMRRFLRNTHSLAASGGNDVVISDDVLKFHERDKREHVRRAWYDRLETYGIAFGK